MFDFPKKRTWMDKTIGCNWASNLDYLVWTYLNETTNKQKTKAGIMIDSEMMVAVDNESEKK